MTLSWRARLGLLLAAGGAVRIGYVLLQPASDPAFARPALDGAVYLAWAREGAPAGAFYLAPLYPLFLELVLAVAGERFALLYLVQHALVIGAAAALAVVARRAAGDLAGLATAALALTWHPLLFFPSRVLGEALAVALLAFALALRPALPAGLLGGLAALARPNLLLVPAAWALVALLRRRGRVALLLLAGAAAAVLPVTLRNLAASGHLVPISSNGGITLYHGNGPGAVGVYTPPDGFSGRAEGQREEATALARARTGRDLDVVEADRWWGAQARRARWEDPLATLGLFARRLALTVGNRELGLDAAPRIDRNPLRWAAPVPFALVLALAVAGLVAGGLRRTGGGRTWAALAAAAVTPLAFYVSSRYRLPLGALLCVPAGCAVALLAERPRCTRALLAGAAAGFLSLAVPSVGLALAQDAGALANRAAAWKEIGALPRAEADARRAAALDPGSAAAAYNLGVILEARGDPAGAEAAWRAIVAREPGHAEAAGNLAGLLIRSGRAAEAVPLLRRALAERPGGPGSAVCRINLVVALASAGDVAGARAAAEEALRAGVDLDPGLREAVGLPAGPGPG